METPYGPWVSALAATGVVGGIALVVRGMAGYRSALRFGDTSTSTIGSAAAGEGRRWGTPGSRGSGSAVR